MITHPTIKQLKAFYHNRFSMDNWGWIYLHVLQCRKCAKKFGVLKQKYGFHHKNIEYKCFKNLSDEEKEKMKICYGACVFTAWRLDTITSLEEMLLHLNAIAALEEDLDIENGERYLQYKSWEEGWEALTTSANWLSEMVSDSERFFLFRDLARIIILTWDKENYQRKFPIYIPDQNIAYIGESLGIKENDAYNICEEEFWDLQKIWNKREQSDMK
jgi:hypothetical protein